MQIITFWPFGLFFKALGNHLAHGGKDIRQQPGSVLSSWRALWTRSDRSREELHLPKLNKLRGTQCVIHIYIYVYVRLHLHYVVVYECR